MTKHKISDLLNELHSKETYIRSDAIKKIIKDKVNDEQIIHALNDVIKNDSSMAVRNFARSALDVFGVEHSAMEETTQIISVNFEHSAPPDTDHAALVLPIWSDRKKKRWSLFAIAVAVFLLTLPYSILSIFLYPLINFPLGLVGLVGLVNNKVNYDAVYWGGKYGIFVAFVWILYIGMATAIVKSNKKRIVYFLYVILIVLLILNVAGCQIMGPAIQID
jgi:hypothetical protein